VTFGHSNRFGQLERLRHLPNEDRRADRARRLLFDNVLTGIERAMTDSTVARRILQVEHITIETT
jgi:hypothetical protein